MLAILSLILRGREDPLKLLDSPVQERKLENKNYISLREKVVERATFLSVLQGFKKFEDDLLPLLREARFWDLMKEEEWVKVIFISKLRHADAKIRQLDGNKV